MRDGPVAALTVIAARRSLGHAGCRHRRAAYRLGECVAPAKGGDELVNGGKDKTMAKAFWIATYRSIKDPAALGEYGKLAGTAIVAAGGRFLVRGTPAKTLEAGMNLRTVVIEFDSTESALAAYNSAAYQNAKKLLGDTVERDIRIVEGAAE